MCSSDSSGSGSFRFAGSLVLVYTASLWSSNEQGHVTCCVLVISCFPHPHSLMFSSRATWWFVALRGLLIAMMKSENSSLKNRMKSSEAHDISGRLVFALSHSACKHSADGSFLTHSLHRLSGRPAMVPSGETSSPLLQRRRTHSCSLRFSYVYRSSLQWEIGMRKSTIVRSGARHAV